MAKRFMGRKHELGELERLYQSDTFQMVVLYGRRRIGKTTLAMEFANDKPALAFTAKIQSDALNLADFSNLLYKHFDMPQAGAFNSWDDALSFLAKQALGKHLVFIFDEFPYAAQRNEALVSTMQIAIDRHLSKTDMFMILTGSNQGFMEEKILGKAPSKSSSTGLGEKNPLFGRRTAQIYLAPFGYLEAAQMLPNTRPEELVEYYACFGGTPYYISMIDEEESLAQNIERLFFKKEGLLYEEPMMLLRQELREPAVYSSILDAIASGANKPQEIADKIGCERTSVNKYLQTLISMHLIEKVVPFGENRETSRRGIYKISDPCFAFWYAFVQANVDAIEQNAGELAAREVMDEELLSTYVGRWFEEICRQWLLEQAKEGLLPFSPIAFGTWWGTDPSTKEQVDIDVVAASQRKGELLVGECKWRNGFNETKALNTLKERSALIKGYKKTEFALFTKKPVNKTMQEKSVSENLLLADATILYQ